MAGAAGANGGVDPLSHYYETLTKKQQHLTEYHVYNPVESSSECKFDSMIRVMPASFGQQATHSTVVLLTSNGQPVGFSTLNTKPTTATSQYSSMIYGELGTSYGGSSTASSASAGSSKPLLASFTAAANVNMTANNSNNNNNASSVSNEIEHTSESSTTTTTTSNTHSPIQDDPNV